MLFYTHGILNSWICINNEAQLYKRVNKKLNVDVCTYIYVQHRTSNTLLDPTFLLLLFAVSALIFRLK